MNALQLAFNAVAVIFIAVTMFAAGLATTLPALRTVVTDLPLLLLVLLANLVAVPLLGWGIAALFDLPAAGFIALVRTVAILQLVPFAVGLVVTPLRAAHGTVVASGRRQGVEYDVHDGPGGHASGQLA